MLDWTGKASVPCYKVPRDITSFSIIKNSSVISQPGLKFPLLAVVVKVEF